MKVSHEPVVVALAGLEPEWPGTGLAGMGPMKYAEICKKMQVYVKTCTQNMQIDLKICRNMQIYVEICTIFFAHICENMESICILRNMRKYA